MRAALDSSVLIAAMDDSQEHHEECFSLLERQDLWIQSHAVSESFSTLTGGRLGKRVPVEWVVLALDTTVLPSVNSVTLDAIEMVQALHEAEQRGVRGGAVYDYMHLVAARKAGAEKFYTLNTKNFVALHRPGDPEIAHPSIV